MTGFGLYLVIVNFLGLLATFYYAGQGRVEMKRGAGNTQWGGLSCDWVTFNKAPQN